MSESSVCYAVLEWFRLWCIRKFGNQLKFDFHPVWIHAFDENGDGFSRLDLFANIHKTGEIG